MERINGLGLGDKVKSLNILMTLDKNRLSVDPVTPESELALTLANQSPLSLYERELERDAMSAMLPPIQVKRRKRPKGEIETLDVENDSKVSLLGLEELGLNKGNLPDEPEESII